MAPDRRVWLLLPALVIATLLAYQPAWHGGLLWDDDAHVTREGLRTAEGLWRIWFDLGATQQYYPLAHSAFWLQHRLWGDATLGYHLVNAVLHGISAFLVAVILRRLLVPGAVLAAVIFALHPVHVESVAWMTELKNTLSGVLYLSAALIYLKFDQSRRRGSYVSALGVFILALLSKTVTATLPGALLVVFWWKRGRLSWRDDVMPLVPFFAMAIAAGLWTAWVERTYIGAQGFEFELSPVERVLVAGRAAWFYAATLAWPSNLAFVYPKWAISQADPLQYLYPLAAIGLLAALWFYRRRFRGTLATALLFGGTLVPALGFVDVYPFRYSFVADHFQYLASVAPIALFSAGVAILLARWHRRPRGAEGMVILALAIPLFVLTWNQSAQYADADTLYRATLARNPQCWLCHNNLAVRQLERDRGNLAEAMTHFDESLRLNPLNAEGHNNRGVILRRLGRPADALESYREALRLAPNYGDAHLNAGTVLAEFGRLDEAIRHLETALRVHPDSIEAHDTLGTTLARAGRPAEALAHFGRGVQLDPASAAARNNLASALAMVGRSDDAIAHYRESVRLNPGDAKTHDNLGYLLLNMGQPEQALASFEQAVRVDPRYAPSRMNAANVLLDAGRVEEAIEHYQQAIGAAGVDAADVHNDLGVALATAGQPDQAVEHFREALRLRPDFPQARANLARASRRR